MNFLVPYWIKLPLKWNEMERLHLRKCSWHVAVQVSVYNPDRGLPGFELLIDKQVGW